MCSKTGFFDFAVHMWVVPLEWFSGCVVKRKGIKDGITMKRREVK